jgi:hypothetical protein
VPCDGFFVGIRLLQYNSYLCQDAAREGEEKSNKVLFVALELVLSDRLVVSCDGFFGATAVFCHMTVVFVKLLPARAKKKFNEVVFAERGQLNFAIVETHIAACLDRHVSPVFVIEEMVWICVNCCTC